MGRVFDSISYHRWFRPALISFIVSGVVVGITYYWYRWKSRPSHKYQRLSCENSVAEELPEFQLLCQQRLHGLRSINSINSRTSLGSEKRSALFARKVTSNHVTYESECDDLSSSLTDCKRLGIRTLAGVVDQLENLMAKVQCVEEKGLSTSLSDSEQLISDLRLLLEHAYKLREQYRRKVVLSDCEYPRDSLESLAISQDDSCSYFSASEHIDLTELELLMVSNITSPLYYHALKLLDEGEILYRGLRTQFVGCQLDIEYLAKVHCLRQAFDYIFTHPEPTEWLITIGKFTIFRLLHCLGYTLTDFEDAYDRLMDFLKDQRTNSASLDHNGAKILYEELASKGVKVVNFYDVVFDLMLIEAFELLSDPPSSVLTVTRHKWLSDNFKRCALDSTIWTLLLAKRKLLKYPNGFYAHYYSMVGTLMPALAWGFLGPDKNLLRVCNRFRDLVVQFLHNMFICADIKESLPSLQNNLLTVDQSLAEHEQSVDNVKLLTDLANDNDEQARHIQDPNAKSHDIMDSVVTHEDDKDDSSALNDNDVFIEHEQLYLSESIHSLPGLRYTTLPELAEDVYHLISVYSEKLRHLFCEESDFLNNTLPDFLLENPEQPPLINS